MYDMLNGYIFILYNHGHPWSTQVTNFGKTRKCSKFFQRDLLCITNLKKIISFDYFDVITFDL